VAPDALNDPGPGADLQVLAAWAPELADTFVALSCDLALVIDAEDRIVRMAQHEAQPIAPPQWVGQAWRDTVAADSQDKVVALLAEARATGLARRREINHPQALGGAVAVAYSAAQLGPQGPTLAIGHDLRAASALQQRFVAAQEALERSYWQSQQRAPPAAAARPALMTASERQSLGLEVPPLGLRDLDDTELVRALGRLVERIGHGTLPGLLRDARGLAERHFLQRALQRVGSAEALAQALGVSRRTLTRRGGAGPSRRRR
jgi:hypothetical protein